MTYCSGICKQYKAKKKEKWYRPGVARCNFCCLFIETDNKQCPCCKSRLRTQGRGSDVKHKRPVNRIE